MGIGGWGNEVDGELFDVDGGNDGVRCWVAGEGHVEAAVIEDQAEEREGGAGSEEVKGYEH